VRAADEATWLDLAQRCRYATFFHTPHWARIAEAAQPGARDASVIVEGAAGQAVWPLVDVGGRRGRGRTLLSTFAGCYGGPIATDGVDLEELVAALGLGRMSRLHTWWNPFAPPYAHTSADVREDVTHVLDLDPAGPAVEARFDRGPRGWVGRARREGVTVAQSTDWRAYEELYGESLEHWGDSASATHPPELFTALRELAERQPELVRLWVAGHEGHALAGTIVFYWAGHAVSWQTARSHSRPHMGSGPLLVAEVAADAARRGFKVLDLNPSGGHERTADYKRSLGARELPAPVLTWRGSLLRRVRRGNA